MLSLLVYLAATASAPTHIFFDWGKGELTTDATAILDGVAAKYLAAPGPLLIDGHSDRSGPAGPNLASSRKRAEIARDYLAAHGIPASAMRVRAYGEAAPIIATEDGVREVQNRRVEIRFAPGD
ncbi:MAG: OmpA family protein [Sphingomicrobium sp.]